MRGLSKAQSPPQVGIERVFLLPQVLEHRVLCKLDFSRIGFGEYSV